MSAIQIPPIAGIRPAVGIVQQYDVETADCAKRTLPSAPSVCYDLLLLPLSALFVPLVMLFCFLLWFVKSIKQLSLVRGADRATG
jgi:hypothetical protein